MEFITVVITIGALHAIFITLGYFLYWMAATLMYLRRLVVSAYLLLGAYETSSYYADHDK